jgi:FkbM family methyltransferase
MDNRTRFLIEDKLQEIKEKYRHIAIYGKVKSMGRKKAVVFGIGNNWELYKVIVQEYFDVIAYVDNNYKEKGEAVQPVDLLDRIVFDVVIIMPALYTDMYEQCINKGIPKEKIICFMNSAYPYTQRALGGVLSYGQHYEDLIIAAIFANLKIEHPTYMDLGANHPNQISNTALLYKNGCRGINIEANPNFIKIFESERPEDINLNVGVSIQRGKLPFYMFDEYCGRNTFSKEEAEKLCKEQAMQIREIIQIPVVTLQDIVDEYCTNGFPDFLDVDIEGLDYDVLCSYDFAVNGPKVVCVEVRHDMIESFDALFSKYGYFKFCRIGENNIYIRNEFSSQILHYKC